MNTVFISGCYDILHGGHIKEALSLGDHPTVCFALDKVLCEHKQRWTLYYGSIGRAMSPVAGRACRIPNLL